MSYKALWIVSITLMINCGESSEDVTSVSSIKRAIYTGIPLKLPLPTGYKWKVITEAGTGYCGPEGAGKPDCNDKHHVGVFAIDFAHHAEDNHNTSRLFNDGDIDILAAAGGTVKEVNNSGCAPDPDPKCTGSFDLTCRVVIDHDGGYATRYLHFVNGSIKVSEGEHVEQGQFLGKMGTTGCSTGTHLHFDVFHNNSSSTSNADLAGLTLDGLDFLSGYKYNDYRPSTNGFTYLPAGDNPDTCSNELMGGSPCTHKATFNVGQQVWSSLQLTNLTKDICFKIEFYLGDIKKADSSEFCSDSIEKDGGWAQATLSGSYTPGIAGTTWNARYFVRFNNISSRYLPDPAGMAVTSNFTVTNIPVPAKPTLISPISTPAFPPTTQVSASSLNLQWTSSAGAISYNLLFYVWNGSEWAQVGSWTTPGSPVTVSGVPTNTYCSWAAQACNGAVCSAWSDVGYFQTGP